MTRCFIQSIIISQEEEQADTHVSDPSSTPTCNLTLFRFYPEELRVHTKVWIQQVSLTWEPVGQRGETTEGQHMVDETTEDSSSLKLTPEDNISYCFLETSRSSYLWSVLTGLHVWVVRLHGPWKELLWFSRGKWNSAQHWSVFLQLSWRREEMSHFPSAALQQLV